MLDYAWETLLTKWSEKLIEIGSFWYPIPETTLASGWLGFEGATEQQISLAEKRLGITLPPSYRQFLKLSNGWRDINSFIYRLWSVEEIDWFSVRNQDWITAWTQPENDQDQFFYEMQVFYAQPEAEKFVNKAEPITLRVEHLQTAIEISEVGDSAILLLNPKVITENGEWEAWFFASWLPGAERFNSFWELMLSQYEQLAQA